MSKPIVVIRETSDLGRIGRYTVINSDGTICKQVDWFLLTDEKEKEVRLQLWLYETWPNCVWRIGPKMPVFRVIEHLDEE